MTLECSACTIQAPLCHGKTCKCDCHKNWEDTDEAEYYEIKK